MTSRLFVLAFFALPMLLGPAYGQNPSPTGALNGVDYTFQRMTATRTVDDRFDHGRITLVALVFKPLKNDRHEVVLVSHGSTGGQIYDPREPLSSSNFLDSQMRTMLLKRGYTLVLAERRGMAESTGTYAEECAYQAGKCTLAEARERGQPALEEALASTDAVWDQVVLKRLKPRDGKVIAYGGSRGGFLSLAFAAAHPDRVRAVLAVSPGWMSVADIWPADENALRLAWHTTRLEQMGSKFKGPTLWVYAARDPTYADAITRQFFAAYQKGGGQGEYVYIAEHSLPSGHQPAMALWKDSAERFFDALR